MGVAYLQFRGEDFRAGSLKNRENCEIFLPQKFPAIWCAKPVARATSSTSREFQLGALTSVHNYFQQKYI